MTPNPISHPSLEVTLRELQALEPLIYAANGGRDRSYFEPLLAPDFWEVGASGQRYDRVFVLDTLEKRQQIPIDELWGNLRSPATGHSASKLPVELHTAPTDPRLSPRHLLAPNRLRMAHGLPPRDGGDRSTQRNCASLIGPIWAVHRPIVHSPRN